MLLEDAQDQAIDHQPAFLPEQSEEALNLVQGYHLSEESHYPVLTQDEHLDILLSEVGVKLWKLFLDQRPDHFTMHVQTGKLAHVNLFQVVVVQEADRQLKRQHFSTVEEKTGDDVVETL